MSCAGCAFRKGCETWYEPRNRVISAISAAGPLPFACHENLDWRDPVSHFLPLQLIAREGRPRMCEGWKAAVRAQQWPADPLLRRYQRYLAASARQVFERYRSGGATFEQLTDALRSLGRFYRGPRARRVAAMERR